MARSTSPKEKGFFEEEGLEVELIVMEDPKVRFPALAAGQIDVAVSTVDTVLNDPIERTRATVYLFAIDDFKGGDGIVADQDIKSVADLKGRSVAYAEGSVSQHSASLLKEAGLSIKDVESHEHDRGRRRGGVRRRAGRRRGHLGAMADPRAAGAARPSAGRFVDESGADHGRRDHHARETRGAARRHEGAVSRLGQGGRIPEGERKGGG